MTTFEAAKKLGITPQRVRAMIETGRLGGKKIGRDWWITEADIKAVGDRSPGRPKKKEENDLT